jgi:CBS domain containing-hemolysin-like protein
MLGIRTANEHLGLSLPEDQGYATIAGFLMARTGRVLTAGETVEVDQGVFKVERVEKRRIKQIRFTPRRIDFRVSLAPLVLASLAASL